jgi:DNA modification methylase
VSVTVIEGDCIATLRTLPAASHQCCVTSPPYYGLRDYGHAGQIGLEPTPEEYIERMVEVFREVRRVLRDDGTLWLNIGDSYAGSWGAQSRGGAPSASSTLAGNGHVGGGPKIKGLSAVQVEAAPKRTRTGSVAHLDGVKPKDLLMIPAMLALALRADGWWLRKDIIWHKPNPMPESITDRPTSAHEHVFLLAKSERYFYDAEAIKEDAATDEWPGIGPQHESARDRGEEYKPMRQSVPRGGFNGKTNAMPGREAFRAVVARRNSRDVWTIATQPFSAASIPGWDEDHDHYAVMPPALAERCIKAGTRPGDVVIDPFGGAGTTGLVADRLGRGATLLELNPKNVRLARARIMADAPLLMVPA